MAQEEANKAFYDFMYGRYLLKRMYGIEMHQDDYVEDAYNVWRDIGNIATATHAIEITIPADGESYKLPCNVEFIEAVSHGEHWVDQDGDHFVLFHADWNYTTQNPNYLLADALVRNPSRIRLDSQQSQLHPEGEFIPYTLEGTLGNYSIKFDQVFGGLQAVIIYRGVCVDQDGNPLLTRKEATAIAAKIAFLETQLAAFKKDPEASNLLQYIKTESGRLMAAAKIPEYISQNQWNRLLSTMTRHDRKVYWSSYKTVE